MFKTAVTTSAEATCGVKQLGVAAGGRQREGNFQDAATTKG